MSDKILPQHLQRRAILYVRQSSTFQVAHNTESQRLQYAMRQRLELLGWTDIEVIDEDLGCTASGAVERSGFQRLVAEVALGHVGAVAAREVSRFARNSRDWQQLIDVCRVLDTLLIDQDVVYSPRNSNDRLLLGLKGSLNEYELDLFRQRAVEARLAKARRGELIAAVPVGFLKTEDQRLQKDPDQRVQEAIRLVFSKFLELGTVRQTLLWFLEHELQLPVSRPGDPTAWRRPRYSTIHRLLTNPTYGGAYAYGKTVSVEDDPERPGRHIRRRAPENWLALLPGAHEGYIDWEQFQEVQARIAGNVLGAAGPGAAKRGNSLLAGLLRCRRCGRKLVVHYTGRGHVMLRYACMRGHLDQAEPKCISFGGTNVDEAVGQQILRVVEPVALAAARQASVEAGQAHDEVLDALRRDLEAANYAADRAQRQYNAVDPANRLVAGELERRWEQALVAVGDVQARIDRIDRHQDDHPPDVAPGEATFTALAADLESVWLSGATDARLRKRIVRLLLEEVLVDVDSAAGEIHLLLRWKGGVHTELRLPRRRRGSCQATEADVVVAVQSLLRICDDRVIAGLLNRNGHRTGRGNRWTKERVHSLRAHRGMAAFSPERKLADGWLTLTEAAAELGVASHTLRSAIASGAVVGEHPLADGPWIINRAALQTEGAAEVAARARRRRGHTAEAIEDTAEG